VTGASSPRRRVQDCAPEPDSATTAWLAQNLAEQQLRHREIVAAMQALEPARKRWIADFLERIQRRGYNEDGDSKRRIPRSKLPTARRRRHRVVF
jgi:ABC-type protease/lipase transport system fused ATPase/permease subunit